MRPAAMPKAFSFRTIGQASTPSEIRHGLRMWNSRTATPYTVAGLGGLSAYVVGDSVFVAIPITAAALERPASWQVHLVGQVHHAEYKGERSIER